MHYQNICHDTRPCFGRDGRSCIILNETYPKDGDCPFCKASRLDSAEISGRVRLRIEEEAWMYDDIIGTDTRSDL